MARLATCRVRAVSRISGLGLRSFQSEDVKVSGFGGALEARVTAALNPKA